MYSFKQSIDNREGEKKTLIWQKVCSLSASHKPDTFPVRWDIVLRRVTWLEVAFSLHIPLFFWKTRTIVNDFIDGREQQTKDYFFIFLLLPPFFSVYNVTVCARVCEGWHQPSLSIYYVYTKERKRESFMSDCACSSSLKKESRNISMYVWAIYIKKDSNDG